MIGVVRSRHKDAGLIVYLESTVAFVPRSQIQVEFNDLDDLIDARLCLTLLRIEMRDRQSYLFAEALEFADSNSI